MAGKKKYRVLVGLTYPATAEDLRRHKAGSECTWARAEPGEIRDDIPEQSIKGLLAREHIEPVTGKEASK